jgi:hypothetical protein
MRSLFEAGHSGGRSLFYLKTELTILNPDLLKYRDIVMDKWELGRWCPKSEDQVFGKFALPAYGSPVHRAGALPRISWRDKDTAKICTKPGEQFSNLINSIIIF